MWLLMADQLKKGNIQHPLLMLEKGLEERKWLDSDLGQALQATPTVFTGNDIYSQMLKSMRG